MSLKSSSSKRILYRLKNLKPLSKNEIERKTRENYYKYLSEEEEEEEVEDKEIVVEQKKINFNDLPEDTIYVILNYLSYNTRIAILKHKYNKQTIKHRLNKMSKSVNGLTKMWKCAKIAVQLEKLICMNYWVSYSVSHFRSDLKREKVLNYSDYYKENFSIIILKSIRHYTKIYKQKHYTSKKIIEHIEEIILNIFACLATK